MRRHLVLGTVGLVVALGVSVHWLAGASLRGRIDQGLEERIIAEREMLERSLRLDALELVEQVRDRAGSRRVAAALAASDAGDRRARAHAAANKISEWFKDPSRKGKLGRPDIVIVTDESGVVIARDADPNRMVGVRLSDRLPMLDEVLRDGVAQSDVFAQDDPGLGYQQVAAAPIRDEHGSVRGALVVAYGLTDGAVLAHAEALGRDLALLVDGKVVASTLGRGAAAALERAAESGLAGLGDDARTPRFDVGLDGEEFAGVGAPLSYAKTTKVTAVLLASRDRADALASLGALVWPLTAGFAVIALVFGWVMANRILFPIAEMEEGVLAVINGDLDRSIEVDEDEFGGLAYRINQLVSFLVGELEAGSAAPSGEGWGSLESNLTQSAPTGPAPTEPLDDPDLAAALADEPEDAYLARVFAEYAEAKRALGEDVGQITAERFAERLLASSRSMGAKHGCPIRFRVERGEGRVILRPVLLRDRAS